MVKRKTMILLLIAMLVIGVALFVGCEVDEPAEPDENNNDQVVYDPDEVYEITLQSVWASGFYLFDLLDEYADEVEQLSGGRLIIDVHPGGSFVPGMEVLDATLERTIDAAHGSEVLWHGRFAEATFFGSFPLLYDPFMFLTWMYERDGLELLHESYERRGENFKILPMTTIDHEILAWSHEPLREVEDWQGLSYRTIGWWGDILRDYGVAVTHLDPAEIFPSLERGVVDAVEYSTPINDYHAGLYELAPYFTGPGIHQPFTSMKIYINEDQWNELPPDLQLLLETSSRQWAYSTWSREVNDSIWAVEYFLEEAEREPTYMEIEQQQELRELFFDFVDDKAAEEDEHFNKVWESVQEFYHEFRRYDDFIRMYQAPPEDPIVER